MVFVRLVFGVWRAIILGEFSTQGGDKGDLTSQSTGKVMGEVENLWIGRAQSGITISTCRDLMLEESPTEPWGRGKFERLGWPLDTTVEVLDELSPQDVQGLSGATLGT